MVAESTYSRSFNATGIKFPYRHLFAIATVSMKKPTTIYQLMLIGFMLVAFPLIVGLVVLFSQIDRLSHDTQSTVSQSAQTVEQSRLVVSGFLGMKRSAEQFLILRDQKLLSRFEQQFMALKQTVDALKSVPVNSELENQLDAIIKISTDLSQDLQRINNISPLNSEQQGQPVIGKPTELSALSTLVEAIPEMAGRFVLESGEKMQTRIKDTKQFLLFQLLALIPVAIFLAIVSSIIINRPLKKLSNAIRQLGDGEFHADIEISGPESIRDLGEKLQWLSERLSHLDQQKLEFLQNVSDELKSPLTAIKQGAELLQNQTIGNLNIEQLKTLQILDQNQRLLQNQIESLLDFNLALTLNEPLPKVPINLKLVIDKVVDLLGLPLRRQQIKVETNIAPARVIGNQVQLESMMENILMHAIKFSPAGGTIKIATNVGNGQVEIIFGDSGQRFREEEVSEVFKPFIQGHQSSVNHVKGAGLGLSIAKRYAELHGGQIRIDDSISGAIVRLSLPLNSDKERLVYDQVG